MAIRKMKVVYADGREVEVKVSPRAQVMTEERVSGMDNRWIYATFFLAWASLHKAGLESADFEAWLDQVDDVEDVETPKPDPTQPAPSANDSSASVS